MSKQVVIIGAGLGGLAAGVKLVNAGVKTLILEQQQQPGGYAVAFKRGKFTFDVALHAIPAGGDGDLFPDLLKQIGAPSAAKFLKLAQGPVVHLGKKIFRMPNDPDQLFMELERLFPAEKKGLASLRQNIDIHAQSFAPLLIKSEKSLASLIKFAGKLPSFVDFISLPTSRYLARFISDPHLKAILFQPAVFPGIRMTCFPAINYILMFHLLVNRGMYTIEGGGAALSRALTERFISLGGQLQTMARVDSILFDTRNRFSAVRLARNEKIDGSCAIANMSLPSLSALVPGDILPGRYTTHMSQVHPSLSVVQLQLGLTCPVRDLGIDSHLTIYFPDADLDACIGRQSESLIPDGFSVTAHGITDSSVNKSDHILSIVGGVSGNKWLALGNDEYRTCKEMCTKALLTQLEIMFPGIGSRIAVSDLATPRTFNRYTGNPLGAIMGFDISCGMHRKIMSVSNVPLAGLYAAGAWTDRLGGFMQSMLSGAAAADKVIHS